MATRDYSNTSHIPPWFQPVVELCRVRNRFASRHQCRSTGLAARTVKKRQKFRPLGVVRMFNPRAEPFCPTSRVENFFPITSTLRVEKIVAVWKGRIFQPQKSTQVNDPSWPGRPAGRIFNPESRFLQPSAFSSCRISTAVKTNDRQ